jgi:hypothetical protein
MNSEPNYTAELIDSLEKNSAQINNDFISSNEEDSHLEQKSELVLSEQSDNFQNSLENLETNKENNQDIKSEFLKENKEIKTQITKNESQNLNETNNSQHEQQASTSDISEENSGNNMTIKIIDFQHEWDQLSDNEKMLGLLAPVWLPDDAAGF